MASGIFGVLMGMVEAGDFVLAVLTPRYLAI
jgi:hypothetical protein